MTNQSTPDQTTPDRPRHNHFTGHDDTTDRTARAGTPRPESSSRLAIDPESAEQGFARLVLTVVELLRQLVERQSLRRIDNGDLSDDQIERIGRTLMALDEQMAALRQHFGLDPDDLNIDLGPLGSLLPRR